jgi:copper chaperone CopZ
VQAALAKGLGVSKDKVKIDYAAKTACVEMDGAKPDMKSLAKAMDDTGKFEASLAD